MENQHMNWSAIKNVEVLDHSINGWKKNLNFRILSVSGICVPLSLTCLHEKLSLYDLICLSHARKKKINDNSLRRQKNYCRLDNNLSKINIHRGYFLVKTVMLPPTPVKVIIVYIMCIPVTKRSMSYIMNTLTSTITFENSCLYFTKLSIC